MIKKILYLLILSLVLVISSCSIENDDLVEPNSNTTNPSDSIAKVD